MGKITPVNAGVRDAGNERVGSLEPRRARPITPPSASCSVGSVGETEGDRAAALHAGHDPRVHGVVMRIESSVTSLSWIPSEAVTGLNKAVFGSGFTHYDDPPPDVIRDLEALRDADRFRFANHLVGWIEFDGERIVDAGYGGGCLDGGDHRRGRRQAGELRRRRLRRHPARDRTDRDVGDVRADGRRAHRGAGTATGEQAAVREVRGADGVVDACRSRSTPTARASSSCSGPARSLGTGCTTPPASSPPRPASPTSRTGGATRSASTRRGATRTRRRWSPPSRPPSNASSPARSCAAARSRRSAS